MEPTLPWPQPTFSLRVNGAGGGEGRRVSLRPGISIIGSRVGCDIRLCSPKVSPLHCAIVHTGDRAALRDLGSKSGTTVNDWEAEACLLTHGDRIQIRRWQLVLEAAAERQEIEGRASGDADQVGAGNELPRLPASEQIELRNGHGEPVLTSRSPVVLIGRGARCDLTLDDRRLSRSHALLFHTVEGWAVADLSSTNGTRVNERVIAADESRPAGVALSDGDVLSLGGCRLTVRLADGCDAGESTCGDDTLTGTRGRTADPATRNLKLETRNSQEPEPLVESDQDPDTTLCEPHAHGDAAEPQRCDDSPSAREARIEAERTALEARSAALVSMEQDLARRAEAIATQERRIGRQRSEAERLLAEVQAARTGQTALAEKESSLAASQEKLAADWTALERAGRDYKERERSLEARIAAAEERAGRLELWQRELEDREGRMGTGEADLAKRVVGAARAVDLCKQRIAELDARETSLKTTAEKLERQRIAHEAVARTLAEKERQTHRAAELLADRERRLGCREQTVAAREAELKREAEALTPARKSISGDRERIATEHLALQRRLQDAAQREAELDRRGRELTDVQQQLGREKARLSQQSEALKGRAGDLQSALDKLRRREAEADAREAGLQRLADSLDERQRELERVARETTAKLDRMYEGRAALASRQRALAQREQALDERDRGLTEREARQRESAAAMHNISATLEQYEEQLGTEQQRLQDREAKLDEELRYLLSRSVELRRTQSLPGSPETPADKPAMLARVERI